MIQTYDCMTDDERHAWLTSARAWGEAFPQYADLAARIEARLWRCECCGVTWREVKAGVLEKSL